MGDILSYWCNTVNFESCTCNFASESEKLGNGTALYICQLYNKERARPKCEWPGSLSFILIVFITSLDSVIKKAIGNFA